MRGPPCVVEMADALQPHPALSPIRQDGAVLHALQAGPDHGPLLCRTQGFHIRGMDEPVVTLQVGSEPCGILAEQCVDLLRPFHAAVFQVDPPVAHESDLLGLAQQGLALAQGEITLNSFGHVVGHADVVVSRPSSSRTGAMTSSFQNRLPSLR